MADNKDVKENLKTPEKSAVPQEQKIGVEQRREVAPEKIESQERERILAELHREVDRMELDDTAKASVEKEKEKIEYLAVEDKIEHLLKIAREKGVVFAVQIARKMNEPYLLDILHDTLANEGYFKDFTK